VETNGRRSRNDFEYELLDTGIFDDDRYFDVFLEYAKETPEDILIKVTDRLVQQQAYGKALGKTARAKGTGR
jgi:hypothetical protein